MCQSYPWIIEIKRFSTNTVSYESMNDVISLLCVYSMSQRATKLENPECLGLTYECLYMSLQEYVIELQNVFMLFVYVGG